jgi:hypothetical protein
MSLEYLPFAFAFALLAGMLIALDVGRRLRRRERERNPGATSTGLGPIEGSVFGLLGLLVAFTFSGAATRFDTRRALIGEEANDIGTAYLRLDLLPPAAQPALRDAFRRYVDSRLEVYRRLPDVAAARAALADSARIQHEIWQDAVAACRADGTPTACMLLLPALNAMFDITTTRTLAAQTHPPPVIFGMLFGLAVASALLAGYEIGAERVRHWLHAVGFVVTLAVAVFVILDIEYPRLGLIRLTAFDQVLVDLRHGME